MHNGCILCGGVGVGKSHTAVGYYLQNEAPRKVYVITTAKKRDKFDWQELFAQVGMIENPELTMGATVKVDSWENIKKYEEVTDAFFIFDEQRLVGTGRWVKAFYKIAAANRWIMLSATPGDNWLDYVPVFRANGFIKNITQFKEDHVVSRWTGRYYQVTGYRQVPKLVRWRNSLLVDMPYEKHTTRHTHYVAVDYDKDLVKELVNKRWHVYENRPLTDASELFRVMRKVVYSDASRLRAVSRLLETHPKLIVFYNFDYELEMLRKLAQSDSTLSLIPTDTKSVTTQSTQSRTADSSGRVRPDPTTTLKWDDSTKTLAASSQPVDTGESENTDQNGYWTIDEGNDRLTVSQIPTASTGKSNDESMPIESLETSNPWDYLLSPDGMRENILLSTGIGSPISTSLVPMESSEPTQPNRSTSSSDLESGSPETRTETLRTITDTAGSICTSTTESTGPTALSAEPTDLSRMSETLRTTENLKDVSKSEKMESGSGYARTVTPSIEIGSRSSASVQSVDSAMSPPTTLKESSTSTTTLSSGVKRSFETSSVANSKSRQDAESSESSRNTSESSLDQRHSSSTHQSSTTASATTSTEPRSTGGTDSLEGSDTCQTSTGESSAAQTDLISSPDGRKTKPGSASPEDSAKTTTSTRSSKRSHGRQGLSAPGRSSGCEQSFQVAEWNGHKHEEVPTTTSWVYLVQYVAGAEAWECVETDAMVFYSMPYSYKLWWQAHGRIDRLHTSFLDLHYYILFGDSILERAVKKSLSMKKSFNESALGRSLGLS